ncbi:membrane protein [Neorhizobium sp. NCHU2750]|nr:membrane protein [Neorhizobium sp. NCHU2750]
MRPIGKWFASEGGNVAITAALALPVMISALALGVDYGYLTLQQRELQATADLSAISAAATPSSPEAGVLDYMTINGKNIAVLKNGVLLNKGASVTFNPDTVFDKFDAYAEVVNGHYQADPSVAAASRFQTGVAPYDTVKVTLYQKGGLFFGGSIAKAPTLSAAGTASIDKMASFSVGSRLASLNGGVVNALLGSLLGTNISLSVMDYQSLANANVDLLKVFDQLAIKLNLTAGTYNDLLNTDISYGTLLNAIGQTTGVTPAVASILKTLEKTLGTTKLTVRLKDIMDIGPLASRLIGQSDGLTVQTDIFNIISASANAANGGKNQIDLNLGATIPGLGGLTLSVAVGEPPVGSKALGIGRTGSVVRTAQTRVALTTTVDGITGLLGIKVRVPLYIEVANAEGRMSSITCASGSNGATVNVEAIPGVLELSLGDVDTAAFANFGKDPRVTKTKMVATPALNLTALAYANATNVKTTQLAFSPSDISGQKVKQASTKDTLTTLVDSLLTNLQVEVEILGLKVAVPPALLGGLADTLKLLTAPLDQVLYSVLSTVGVKIGEVDVRVGGASCRNPVLVQ